MKKPLLQLTSVYGGKALPVLIDPMAIETMHPDQGRTRVSVPTHNNGGWTVKESIDEIVEKMRLLGVQVVIA